MPGLIALWLGGLIATYLISRVLLFLTKKWDGGTLRIIVVHTLSLALVLTLSAFGHADPAPVQVTPDMVITYLPPQLVWLGVDLWRLRPTPSRA